MYDARYETQNSKGDVNEKIGITSSFQKYTDWWKNDGQNDFTNIRTGEWHFRSISYFLVVDSRKINNNGCELQKKTNSELSIQKTIEFEE